MQILTVHVYDSWWINPTNLQCRVIFNNRSESRSMWSAPDRLQKKTWFIREGEGRHGGKVPPQLQPCVKSDTPAVKLAQTARTETRLHSFHYLQIGDWQETLESVEPLNQFKDSSAHTVESGWKCYYCFGSRNKMICFTLNCNYFKTEFGKYHLHSYL